MHGLDEQPRSNEFLFGYHLLAVPQTFVAIMLATSILELFDLRDVSFFAWIPLRSFKGGVAICAAVACWLIVTKPSPQRAAQVSWRRRLLAPLIFAVGLLLVINSVVTGVSDYLENYRTTERNVERFIIASLSPTTTEDLSLAWPSDHEALIKVCSPGGPVKRAFCAELARTLAATNDCDEHCLLWILDQRSHKGHP